MILSRNSDYDTTANIPDSNTLYNITDTGHLYKGNTLIADKTRLYSGTGSNTDGAMTQAAATGVFVNKSGDTMTGQLTVSSSVNANQIRIQNLLLDRTVTPTSNLYVGLKLLDVNGVEIGSFYHRHSVDGKNYNAILCGGINNTAALYVGLTADETPYCTFPSTTCVDGQWVYKYTTIASDVSINGSSALTYSLSSYLPNDGHEYEILISATGQTDTTLNHSHVVYIQTDIMTANYCLWRARTVISGTALFSGGNAILPVGTGRSLKLTRNSGYYGTVSLFAFGYRRIGTNA